MKALTTIATALLIALLILAPDVILSFFVTNLHKSITFYALGAAFCFTLFMVMSKSRIARIAALSALIFLQLTALLYAAYFGSEIMPEILAKFFNDFGEDSGEVYMILTSQFSPLHIAGIVTIAAYAAILFILYKTDSYTLKMRGASVLLILVLLVFPSRAAVHTYPNLFYPSAVKPSLYNIANTFTLTFRNMIQGTKHQKDFLDYELTFSDPMAKNIVLVMGESTRSKHISLFGYPVKTSPLLEQKCAENHCVHSPMISGAVTTVTSLQAFFNLMLEPGNFNTVVSKNANLFRIAKEQGYKTTLISVQSSGLLYGAGTEYVDNFVSREEIDDAEFLQKRDIILTELLDKAELSDDKNFIVLHMRSQHAPYTDNYDHLKNELSINSDEKISTSDLETANLLSYENATRFTDLVIDKIVDHTKSKFGAKGKSYLFFTSDHGEMLGEDGLFGHNQLHIDCADVPFIAFPLSGEDNYIKHLMSHTPKTHYDMGLEIAKLLGVSIKNPNIKDSSIRYLHGVNIMYPYSYLEFAIKGGNVMNIIQKHTSK